MDQPRKRCSTCHLALPLTEYNRRAAAPDGLQARCRSCSRQWYVDNETEHKANVRARNDRVRAELATRLKTYLLEHPCVDCGEPDIRVLDFDHEDPCQKLANVHRLVAGSHSWERVAAEIAKCSVRCANCHRRRTAEMFGYWRATAERERVATTRASAAARLEAIFAG